MEVSSFLLITRNRKLVHHRSQAAGKLRQEHAGMLRLRGILGGVPGVLIDARDVFAHLARGGRRLRHAGAQTAILLSFYYRCPLTASFPGESRTQRF